MKDYSENDLLKICPVCGYPELEEAPFDKFGYPTYVICSCCGFEFGFDDESEGVTYEIYREVWLANGANFWDKKHRPKTWNPESVEKQLLNINKVSHYKPRFTK